jgi:putative oxidoreductase
MHDYVPLLARILIGLLFLIPGGLSKLGNIEGFTGFLVSGGLPAFLTWPSIVFEIVLGLALIVGFQTRAMALLGAGFCVVAGLLYHFHPDDPIQVGNFFKNLAITGGLLLLALTGPGKLAFDRA